MRLTPLLLVFTLSACATAPTRIEPNVSVGVLDFRRHTIDGFFISPDPYSLPHTALGVVIASVHGGATRAQNVDRVGSAWRVDDVSPDSAVSVAKARVLRLGGDAIVNFEIRPVPRVELGAPAIPGWEVRGLAILRTARSRP